MNLKIKSILQHYIMMSVIKMQMNLAIRLHINVIRNERNEVKTNGLREKLDFLLVKPVIWIKHKLGLGIVDNIQLAKELHKPITRKFKRRKIFVSNINKIWSADLMDKSNLS